MKDESNFWEEIETFDLSHRDGMNATHGLGLAIWLSGSIFLFSLAMFLLWYWRP